MTFKKYLAVAWAIAIVWMYFGSLINFHQHQIWKKQLNPTFAVFKREKAKAGVCASWSSNTDEASVPPVSVADFPLVDLNPYSGPVFAMNVMPFQFQDLKPSAYDPGSCGLRAPPVC
ncbi:MAG: hypothetical protein WCO63_04490 [Bacteroidota bacterium]